MSRWPRQRSAARFARSATIPLLAGVALLAAGCTLNLYPPGPPGTPPARPAAADPDSDRDADADADSDQDSEDDPFEPWDEVLEDTRAIEGYFTFHLGRDNTLFLEVRPGQLDRDFGLVMHLSRGVGDFNLHDGLPLGGTRLMRFRRVGDELYLVHRNPRFTADPGSPMRVSLEDNIGHSVVRAFEIESEHEDTKNVLIDVTDFIVSDYANLADRIRLYYGGKPVTFDADRSHVADVMGFPRNVEIDAALTFRATDPPVFGAEALADWRSVPVGVRYSFVALPDVPMRPRLADDRIGHFLTVREDFSRDREETGYVRYVNRWRLEKREPGAELSEPVEPIVYYIDRSVPYAYRRYVREGIEAWNRAFEAAGFRNAIIVREAPTPAEDPDWSAEDARYSTVRWTAAHRMGYAIGPSQTDPRTGEILNADILISSTLVRSWLFEYQERAAPGALLRGLMGARGFGGGWPGGLWESGATTVIGRVDDAGAFDAGAFDAGPVAPPLSGSALVPFPFGGFPFGGARRLCLAETGKAHQLALQYTALVGLGVLDGGEPMPEEYLGAAIRDLVMHEVGHTLGLRHNFKASSGIPYERLHDEAFTREHGVTLSVMDYDAANIALDPAEQGFYWNQGVGTYDIWAIRYAYAPIYEQAPDAPFAYSGDLVDSPEAELVGLRKIAEQAADPLHAYGTDEDAMLGVFTVDPLTNAWDLGSDPLRYAEDRLALVDRVRPRLDALLVDDGDRWQRLRGAVEGLIMERLLVLIPATRMVGGVYVSRGHKGDPGARAPLTPVPAARQREAVRLLVEHAFAEDAFDFDPALLNRLAPERWSHWGIGRIRIPLDFPVHGYVALVQSILLDELLDPARISRMLDNELRAPAGSEVYPASELFRTVTEAVWTELGPPLAPAGGGRAGQERPPPYIDSFRRSLQRAHLDALTRLLFLEGSPVLWFSPTGDTRALARLELVRLLERIEAALAGDDTLDTYTRAHLADSRARIERALEASISLGRR